MIRAIRPSGGWPKVTKQQRGENIYGEVNSAAGIRKIDRLIRAEIRSVKNREQVTELKRRSDYLCTLTRSPSWRTRFGKKADLLLTVAKDENARTGEAGEPGREEEGLGRAVRTVGE